ncbi:MAG: type II toxin-antitoxin system VapC family toxin [Planctomycetes bacterium]|nr:type II toxin-antitoxin system VapC family toxin [Planctomycetota bacterium]
MLILVDTNVLLRLVEPAHSQHVVAAEAIGAARDSGYRTLIVPQVVYEFWAVATRPVEANGLGLTTIETQLKLEGLLPTVRVLRDERAIYERWQQVVADHDVKGKQVHDARLVAAMLRHDISHLLTFNAPDFARYSEITVVEPHRASDLEPAH